MPSTSDRCNVEFACSVYVAIGTKAKKLFQRRHLRLFLSFSLSPFPFSLLLRFLFLWVDRPVAGAYSGRGGQVA